MSRKTAEPLLSNTQYNTVVGVWTQIIWVYKVYGFQRLQPYRAHASQEGKKKNNTKERVKAWKESWFCKLQQR